MRLLLTLLLAACASDDDGGSGTDAAGVDGLVDVDAAGMADARVPMVTITTLVHRALGPENLALVAFQDGDGPWTVLEGSGGTYVGAAPSGRYGVAGVCPDSVELIHRTTVESSAVTLLCAGGMLPTPHTFSANVGGITTEQLAVSHLAGSDGVAAPAFSTMVAEGVQDIALDRRDVDGTGRVIVDRALAVTGNVTRVYDFNDQGNDVIRHVVTVDGAEAPEATSFLRTSGGTLVPFSVAASSTIAFLPFAGLAPGDVHRLEAAGSSYRLVRWRQAAGDLALASPLPITASATKTGTPPRIRATFSLITDADQYLVWIYPTGRDIWRAHLSNGWVAGSGSYETPDLSPLPGWDAAWNLPSGVTTDWHVSYASSNRGLEGVIADAALAGDDSLDVDHAEAFGSIPP